MRTTNTTRAKLPTINLTGTGRITPIVEGITPNVTATELSDCELNGSITVSGLNSEFIMFQSANIGNCEIKIEGSYNKIAFVNCKFEESALVTIYEDAANSNREVLLMGCSYVGKEGELLLSENEEGDLDWKVSNLWICDDAVFQEDLPALRSYLHGETKGDVNGEIYHFYSPDEEGNSEKINSKETPKMEEEESSVGWKISLATLGVAAMIGLAGKKSNKKEVMKNVRQEKEVLHRHAGSGRSI